MAVAAVLVHGLWHGGWTWDAVRSLLAARGIDAVAPDLPMSTLTQDVATVRTLLDGLDRPVVLVGHSYGGAVATAAGSHPAVRGLIYVAAFALAETESISRVAPELAIAPTRLGEALRFSQDGAQVSIDPEAARPLLYGRTPDAVATAALSRLRPVGRALFSDRPAQVAWRERRAVYAVCTADKCVAPALQQVMAARCEDSVEWMTDHSAPASRPDLVAELIAREVARVARSAAEGPVAIRQRGSATGRLTPARHPGEPVA